MGGLLTCIEFIDGADPFQPGFGQVIQRDQVVVTGQPVDRPDAHLVQSSEKILGHIHRLLKAVEPVIERTHDVLSSGQDEIQRRSVQLERFFPNAPNTSLFDSLVLI